MVAWECPINPREASGLDPEAVHNSDRWQEELQPLFEDRDITNKGNQQNYFIKMYEVDQSRLPESYYETLVTAFEEHLPIANVVDKILDEALQKCPDRVSYPTLLAHD